MSADTRVIKVVAAPRRAPTTGRPAKSFSTQRAQKWILAAAILSAVIYGFRRIVEPATGNTSSTGTAAQKLAGTATPPTASHWAVAYGAGFLILSVISLGAPEVAASIAMLMVVGELLTNGVTIASDIANLQGTPAPVAVTPAPSTTPANATQVNQATGATK